jgi:hypothetical protein
MNTATAITLINIQLNPFPSLCLFIGSGSRSQMKQQEIGVTSTLGKPRRILAIVPESCCSTE